MVGAPPVSRYMTLKLFMLLVKLVSRYGPVINSMYGSVILVNCFQGLAPSILEDSYRSCGIFIRIPVAISIR